MVHNSILVLQRLKPLWALLPQVFFELLECCILVVRETSIWSSLGLSSMFY